MKTPQLAPFFQNVCCFSSQSLARQMSYLSPEQTLRLLKELKKASIRDQLFEQAAGFRNAEKALSELRAKPRPRKASTPA